MTTPTADFIALCNRIGADPEFTRAGGGNSSAKTGTTLRIKPSGVPLATLREEDLVPLDIPTLLDALNPPAPEGEDPFSFDEDLTSFNEQIDQHIRNLRGY